MVGTPGSYILFLRLPRKRRITVGKLGTITFPSGLYAYVGSALNGWEARVDRHLTGKGKIHWHVDYLRAEAQVEWALVIESSERLECTMNKAIANRSLVVAPGFGSSDCDCLTHLHLLRTDTLRR